jgi:hypothetical protein
MRFWSSTCRRRISPTSETFHFALDRKKLRQAWWREGGYLLRSNIKSDDPGYLWRLYPQLVEVEQAFKEITKAPAAEIPIAKHFTRRFTMTLISLHSTPYLVT